MDALESAWNEISAGLGLASDERMVILFGWAALLAALTAVAVRASRPASRLLALSLAYGLTFWLIRESLVTPALLERNWQISTGAAALAGLAAWLACRRSAL